MERRVLTDIPDDQVNFVVATMKADGAQVTQDRQSNDLWTVTGVFPDRVGEATPGLASVAEAAFPQARPRPAETAVASGSRDMAIDTLARTLWGEARGEPRLGKEAVAAVVLNRVKRGRPDRFGATVEEVCRKPKQFSCWNPGDPNRALLEHVDRTDAAFAECLEVAQRAVEGTLPDPTDGSDHYHRDDVFPDWSRGKVAARTIGRHRFFNDIA